MKLQKEKHPAVVKWSSRAQSSSTYGARIDTDEAVIPRSAIPTATIPS